MVRAIKDVPIGGQLFRRGERWPTEMPDIPADARPDAAWFLWKNNGSQEIEGGKEKEEEKEKETIGHSLKGLKLNEHAVPCCCFYTSYSWRVYDSSSIFFLLRGERLGVRFVRDEIRARAMTECGAQEEFSAGSFLIIIGTCYRVSMIICWDYHRK